MRLLFKCVNLDTMPLYLELWKKTPQKSSDYSSGVLMCWEGAMGYELAFDSAEELAWIKGSYPEEHYLAPVGDWGAIHDWEGIIRARFGNTAMFQLVQEPLADIWRSQMGGAVTVAENRAGWEYLHKVSELADLSGNKYMRKRNRVNQFKKMNPFEYIPITPALIPAIAEFQREWCESYREFSGYESIKHESEGILRNILGNWELMPQLLGGAIETMGRIVAYTIAEDAGDGIVMIHFEKALLSYNAAYQVINREFMSHVNKRFNIVNREEDMGDPGLHDAKMSYHPYDFVKKYTVTIDLR